MLDQMWTPNGRSCVCYPISHKLEVQSFFLVKIELAELTVSRPRSL